jgi:hypothetical protein
MRPAIQQPQENEMADPSNPGAGERPRARKKSTRDPSEGSTNLRGSVRKLMNTRTSVRQNGKPYVLSNQELLLLGLIEKASRGDTRSATAIIDMVMKLDAMAGRSAPRSAVQSDTEVIEDFLRRNGAKPVPTWQWGEPRYQTSDYDDQ